MVKALEIIGNLLDEASVEAQKLPNEYTRGQLNGVKRAYQVLMKEIEKPSSQVNHTINNEEIPFSAPPMSERGRMQKYSDQTTDMLLNVQSSYTQEDSFELVELTKIRELLETLLQKAFPELELTDEAQDFLDSKYKPEPKYEPEESYRELPTRWNKSFGEGLLGSSDNFVGEDQTVYDPDTGEQGKVRTIGKKFNPDEQTVEEWNNQVSRPPNVYVDTGDDELEDLTPGG